MNITVFIGLVTVFSVITSLCTEACKKILDEINVKYASNILVCIIAAIVGILGTCAYYVLFSLEFNAVNIVCILLMSLTTAVGSMVGYDKVIQTIKQIASGKQAE